MGASKDLDLTLHPRTTTEDALLWMVHEYDEHQKTQKREKALRLLIDHEIDLLRACERMYAWVQDYPTVASEFHERVRCVLDHVEIELSLLSRSLYPSEQQDPGAIDNC